MCKGCSFFLHFMFALPTWRTTRIKILPKGNLTARNFSPLIEECIALVPVIKT